MFFAQRKVKEKDVLRLSRRVGYFLIFFSEEIIYDNMLRYMEMYKDAGGGGGEFFKVL